MRTKNIFSWLIFILLLAVLMIGLLKFQDISDWLKLRGYEPGERIVQLADHTTMKDPTRRLFYVNHPQLNEKPEFRQNCGDTSEKTIVLGCFINHKGIYLLNVADSRLNGVVEVTAAHEVLHAQYERLGQKERERVDKLTADFFSTLNNERIINTIEDYRTRDPDVVANELHSILATEVRDLTPELETYYSRYFTDRKQIVSYSEQYEQAFIDIETKAEDYNAKLEELTRKIDNGKTKIEALNKKIESEQSKMDSLRSSNRIEEYNAAVGPYNNLISQYNSLLNKTRQDINAYNDLLEERNKLAIQQQELYDVIDANSVGGDR